MTTRLKINTDEKNNNTFQKDIKDTRDKITQICKIGGSNINITKKHVYARDKITAIWKIGGSNINNTECLRTHSVKIWFCNVYIFASDINIII